MEARAALTVTHHPNQLLTPHLRHSAQIEADELVRFKLRTCADEIDAALNAFTFAPSSAALSQLQGVWAAGVRALGNAGASRHVNTTPETPK